MQKIIYLVYLSLPLIYGDNSLIDDDFGENYFAMPKLNEFDDYDECMGVFRESAKYCYVKSIIKPPDYSSDLYNFIVEFSSRTKQHYRHDKLARGICVNKCVKLLESLNDTAKNYYEPPFGVIDPKFTFDFVNFPNASEDRKKFDRSVNQCINIRLMKSHNLTAYSSIQYCRGNTNPFEIDSLDIFFVCLFLTIVSVTYTSTFCDYWLRKKKNNSADADDHYKTPLPTLTQKFIVSFSLWRNWYILSAPTKEEVRDLRAISAIRIWSMIAIVYGHATMFIMGAPIQNPVFVEKNYHLLKGMIVINGGNLVQTFFFLSGFLNSISLLSYVERTHKKNLLVLLKATIYRIVRFVPVLLFLVLLHATWLQRLDDGPYWDKFNIYERQACRTNMWSNLLLINNYVSGELKCMIHTWYISADFQLSIFGTALLLLTANNPKKKNLLLFGSIAISFFITFIHLYVNKLEPILMLPPETLRDQLVGGSEYDRYLNQYHTATHLNSGNYLVGLVIGYFYYYHKQANGRILHKKNFWTYVLWNCSWCINFALCFIGLYFYENDIELGVMSSLLGAFFKHFYGVVLGILIIGIFFRYGSIIVDTFNYGMYRVLGRLSFSVYMVHIFIGSLIIMKNKFMIEINNSMLTAFTGWIYMLSHGVALFLVLYIEIPAHVIYKTIVDEIIDKPNKIKGERKTIEEKDINENNNYTSKL